MTGKKANKHHMTDKDVIQAKKMLEDGWTITSICNKLKISRYKFDQTMLAEKKKAEFVDQELSVADQIRENLDRNGTFGKICGETDRYIIELLRKGIPEILIGHLLGLSYDSALDKFEETNESLQNKVRKQAKAEHFISELLKYGNTMDSKGKIDYLKILKESKDDFNVQKDDKSNNVRVIFTNFNRDALENQENTQKLN